MTRTRFPDGNSSLGRLIRLPLRLIPRDHVTRVVSGLNKGMKWIVGSSVHGCWIGTFERDQQQLISSLVKPGAVVWDVGANAGFYTLAFATRVGPSGSVYAFEPFAENVANLLRHLELNQIDNTTVVQGALAASSEFMSFKPGGSNSMGRVTSAQTHYVIPSLSPDEFVKRYPAAVPQFIKIDIEGGESSMLEGAGRVLEQGPDILLSLHGDDQLVNCLRILTAHGYTAYNLDGSHVQNGRPASDTIVARRGRG